MINLQQHFIEFAKKKVQKKDLSAEEKLAMVDELFELWQKTHFDELGATPAAFASALPPADLILRLETDRNELIFQAISNTPACAPLLTNLLKATKDDELKAACVFLLGNFEGEPIRLYTELLTQTENGELRERLIDRLKANADGARELLLKAANALGANDEIRDIAGEILLSGSKNEDTYNYLVDLFLSGKNTPMYAGFLGAYGDERAAAHLYPALDKADFVDYIEIKNAIERLGGLVDEDMRDWTNDPLFRLIKGEKN